MKKWFSAKKMINCACAGCLLIGQVSAEEPEKVVRTKITDGSTQVEVIEDEPAANEPVTVNELVEAAIPPAVKALPAPEITLFPKGLSMAVTSRSPRVQSYINQGLNHLNGGWDFEASRHFAAAMREDPECLLAPWGMVMSLLTPSSENGPASTAAASYLLDLVEKGRGTPLERGYAYALLQYIQHGPVKASDAFRKVSAEFPNDLQAKIFTGLFNRGGYDDFGNALPEQIVSEKMFLSLIGQYPESALPLNALLVIRAQGPDLTGSLPLARQLCAGTPGYPPYLLLLGHYEWRCGNHIEAVKAFSQAAAALKSWMSRNQATLADCPEWVKAESYRIIALSSMGEFPRAYTAATELKAQVVPLGRASSLGNQALMWEAKSLPARLLLNRGNPGDAALALQTLTPTTKTIAKPKLHEWWLGGLTICLDTKRLIDEGKLEEAQQVLKVFARHCEEMAKTRKAASHTGEMAAWNRSMRALGELLSDVRGSLAMAGPESRRGIAYNWFSSAADRQTPDAMMFPPVLLTPLHRHVAEFYLAMNKPMDAVDCFQRALTAFPNDEPTLQGLKIAFEKAAIPTELKKVEKLLEDLKTQKTAFFAD